MRAYVSSMAARIAFRKRAAAYVVAFFVRPVIHRYARPVAMATLLWSGWVWNQYGRLDERTTIACLAVFVLWAAQKLAFRETRDLPQRYYDAFARGDADELAALGKLFRLFHPDEDERAAHENMRLGEEMIIRKRWAEAQAALAKVDLDQFVSSSRAVILNNLAYATARSGNPEEALAIIERAYAEADKSPNERMVKALPSLRGTQGIALTLAGRHEEALPLLALGVEDGSARSRSERWYWLGRVHRTLGREDDARDAFAKAIELGGESGPCAEEAKAALAEGTPFRG